MEEKRKKVNEAIKELKNWLNNYVGGFPVDLIHDLEFMYGQEAVEKVSKKREEVLKKMKRS